MMKSVVIVMIAVWLVMKAMTLVSDCGDLWIVMMIVVMVNRNNRGDYDNCDG